MHLTLSLQFPVNGMKLWGKKKGEERAQESFYEIFGGATITRVGDQYEITWKSPMVTTVTVSSPPEIDQCVKHTRQGEIVRIEADGCRLKIAIKGGETLASFSEL